MEMQQQPIEQPKEQPVSSFLLNGGTTGSTFYTEVNSEYQQLMKLNQELSNYLNSFQSKLSYAKWKQSMVLSYNYEPLDACIKKCRQDQHDYNIKISQDIVGYHRLYNPDQIAQQVISFKEFSSKLQGKLNQLKTEIEKAVMKRDLLKTQVDELKVSLKKLMQNAKIKHASLMFSNGIRTYRDIQSMTSRDTKFLTSRTISNKTSSTFLPHRVAQAPQPNPVATKQSKKFLWEDCLSSILRIMKNKNTSQDIQSGIFLDMVTKQRSKSVMVLKRATPDPKKTSAIYDILINAYKQKQKKTDLDFEIEWETFRNFNWRQLLGVLMLKDGGVQNLRDLSKYWK